MARILIADDEVKILDALEHALVGHSIEKAARWAEVFDWLDKESFDMLVTDVVMPGYKDMISEGVNIVGKLEAYEIPVIFVSGYSESSLAELPGNMRFLKKPFSLRVLNFQVKNLLGL